MEILLRQLLETAIYVAFTITDTLMSVCYDVETVAHPWYVTLLYYLTLGLYNPSPVLNYTFNSKRTFALFLAILCTFYTAYVLFVWTQQKVKRLCNRFLQTFWKIVLVHNWFKQPTITYKANMILESIIPGSPMYEDGKVPECQVGIYQRKGDMLTPIGAGIRIDDYLVTPAHNCTTDTVLLREKGFEYELDTTKPLYLCADMFAYKLGTNIWSKLGVKMAQMAPLSHKTTVTVVSSCDRKYTISSVERNSDMMGRCTYRGSTTGGFSGSAYASGRQIFGIHCHGGGCNGGYQVLYLWTKVKLLIKEVPEESEDYYRDRLGDDFNVEEQGTTGRDDDQYYILEETKNGRFHLTNDPQLVRQLTQEQEDNFRQMTQYKRSQGNYSWADEVDDYDDYEADCYKPEGKELTGGHFSGEYRAPLASGSAQVQTQSAPQASPSTATTEQPRLTKRQRLIAKLEKCSLKELEVSLQSIQRSSKPSSSTNRLRQQPRLNGTASAANSQQQQSGEPNGKSPQRMSASSH